MASAQSPAPSPEAPKAIEVEKVKDNLWVLRGGGGNTAVFATAGGVVVVDAKNPGWGQPVLDKIKTLTDKPVITLINTHTHGDHVSGNVAFPASVEIVTQENTKANMEKMPIFKESAGRGLPGKTFKDKMTLGRGADRIDLYYFGPGHTNGDAWVVFPAHRIVHSGDLFAAQGHAVRRRRQRRQRAALPGDADEGVQRHQERGHHHQRPHAGAVHVGRPEGIRRLQPRLPRLRAGAAGGGQDPEQAAAEWKMPEKYQGYSSEVRPDRLKGAFETLAAEMKK